MKRIILEMFQWPLSSIIEQISEVEKAGYNYIQISPLQPTKDNGFEWWKLYQPIDFTIGNSQIGSKEELIKLCEIAKEHNIKIIADVIINHVASDEGNGLIPHITVNENLIKEKDFWKDSKLIRNWEDRHEVVTYSNGLPCLNLNNKKLQNIIFNLMEDYVACGIEGFRIDSAKSIALPEEGNDFWIKFKDKFGFLFNYSEVIFSPKEIVDSYSKYSYVATSSDISNGDRAVRYVENHDTYLDSIIGYTKNYNDKTLCTAYKNLFNKNENVLFYTRPFNNLWKSNEIIQINNSF